LSIILEGLDKIRVRFRTRLCFSTRCRHATIIYLVVIARLVPVLFLAQIILCRSDLQSFLKLQGRETARACKASCKCIKETGQ